MKKKEKLQKITEITVDNINNIIFELKKDNSLLSINIKTIVIFLFKHFKTPEEIYSKLKILKSCEYDEDVTDAVAKSIIILINNKKIETDLFMLDYIKSLDYFSRMFCIWYFDNKTLSYQQNCDYIEEMIKIIYNLCKLNINDDFDSINGCSNDCSSENDDNTTTNTYNFNNTTTNNSTNDTNNNTNNDTINNSNNNNTMNNSSEHDLIELEDSEEIERLDKQLGAIFYEKTTITKNDKQKIAKICDVVDQIIKKNIACKQNYYKSFMRLLDIDEILYKKIFKILKNSNDDKIFIEALSKYKNIWRNINFVTERIGIKKVFECTCNINSTLSYLDRTLIPKKDFYDFILSADFDLNVFKPLLIHFGKKETDNKIRSNIEIRLKSICNDKDILESYRSLSN